MNGRHFGRLGLRIRCMPASDGVRLALRVLQRMQEHTMFSQVVGPPRSRGTTWSRFKSLRSKSFPQYWQRFLSRSKMLWRGDFTPFFRTRTKSIRTKRRGTSNLQELVEIDMGGG